MFMLMTIQLKLLFFGLATGIWSDQAEWASDQDGRSQHGCTAEEVYTMMQSPFIKRIIILNTTFTINRCASVVSKFMQLDLEKDDVSSFLKDCVIPIAEGIL